MAGIQKGRGRKFGHETAQLQGRLEEGRLLPRWESPSPSLSNASHAG